MSEYEAVLENLVGDLISLDALKRPLNDSKSESVIARLEAGVADYRFKDPNISVGLAEEVINIGRLRQRKGEIALGTMLYADSLQRTGQANAHKTWELLDEAGQLFEEIGDEFAWARTRIGRMAISYEINKTVEAFEDADRAEKIFKAFGRDDKLLALNINRSNVFNNLGYYEKALHLLENLLDLLKTGTQTEAYLSLLYRNIAHSYGNLGQLTLARNYYEKAMEVEEARGQTAGILISLYSLAWIAKTQGNYTEALRLLNRAKSICQTQMDEAYVEGNLLRVYLELNRFVTAEKLARNLLEKYEAIDAQFDIAFAYLLHAYTLEALGKFADATSKLDLALAIFQKNESKATQLSIELDLARLSLKQGQVDEVLQVVNRLRYGLKASGQMTEYIRASLLFAVASKSLGQFDEALSAATEALDLSIELEIPSSMYMAQFVLGQVYEAQNNYLEAVSYYDAACLTIWEMQEKLAISFRSDFLEDKHEAVHALIQLHLTKQNVTDALMTIERLKSQIVLGEIANQSNFRWQVKDEHSRSLIEELNNQRAEYQFIYRILNPSPLDEVRRLTPEERKRLRDDNLRREQNIQALMEQLYIESSSPQQKKLLEIPNISQLQSHLQASETIIEYYDDGQALWAFVINRDTLHVKDLPISSERKKEVLEELQNKFEFTLDMRDEPEQLAFLEVQIKEISHELYCALIAPLEDCLQETERLIIVPYGDLHYLPFAALYTGESYLAETIEISLLPAASLFLHPSPKHKDLKARVLADSWNKSLVSAIDEAMLIHNLCGGEIFLEEDCKLSTLDTVPCKILHIAAHGEYRLHRPELSFIQFHDEQVLADDLFQRDMSYELVVLSACETGRSKLAAGDELIGLGRGFLYAGAGAMLSSLWQVEGDCTAKLMEAFYRNLLQGQNKSQALVQAQRSFLQDPIYRHPIFWAAFQIVGNNEALVDVN